MLITRAPFEGSGKDEMFFDYCMSVEGRIYRQAENRQTLQIEHGGESFFIKRHFGIGWKDILSDLLRARKPVLGAPDEWRAIEALHEAGIAAPEPVALGVRGHNPARLQSFIVTRALVDAVSLEQICERWADTPPLFSRKQRLLEQVAGIARRMHAHGINHRDFYLCHFVLSPAAGPEDTGKDSPLYLIDLHRSQVRKSVPLRWRVKDIGALYFSAMDIGLSSRDVFRFMRWYSGRNLRATLTEDRAFWVQVLRRAERMYRRFHRREPPVGAGPPV